MSERTAKLGSFVGWTIFVIALTMNVTYRQMKHWQDEWYAAHPVVKEVSIVPTIDGVSYVIVRPGQMCAFVSFDKNLHFEAECQPDPAAPKPQKGSKRHKDGIAIIGDNLPAHCKPTPTGEECSYDIYVRDSVTCTSGIPAKCEPSQPIPEKEPFHNIDGQFVKTPVCDPLNLQPFCASTDMLCENSYWDAQKGACVPFAEKEPAQLDLPPLPKDELCKRIGGQWLNGACVPAKPYFTFTKEMNIRLFNPSLEEWAILERNCKQDNGVWIPHDDGGGDCALYYPAGVPAEPKP